MPCGDKSSLSTNDLELPRKGIFRDSFNSGEKTSPHATPPHHHGWRVITCQKKRKEMEKYPH